MSILKLTPSCKDYLWGGSRLRTDFGVQSDLNPLAEAWVLSCHPDGPSYLPDGTMLADYLAAHPEAAGTDCKKFDHEISREELEERIRNNTLTEGLNAVPVKKGDCFFIPSGTLHAICKGVVVVEVQQNSNVTYRVYDYGRVGADGKPRALHVKQALEVMRRTPPEQHDFSPHLAKCDYFTVDVVAGGHTGTADETSFISLLIIEGEGRLTCGGETVQAKKGDSFFITAGSGAYALTGSCKALLTTV